MNRIFKERFAQLEVQANTFHADAIGGLEDPARRQRLYIKENNKFLSWKVKVKDLLSKVCGEDSHYLREFDKFDKNEFGIQTTESNYQIFLRLEAVFLAAKEDFEAGYLLPLRTLIQAEIFVSQIEQAEELLDKEYLIPAAVTAGTVLETAMRELCTKNSIIINDRETISEMNNKLYKAQIYNKNTYKQIIWLSSIRNSAAHGKSNEFDEGAVTNMIQQINHLLNTVFLSQ